MSLGCTTQDGHVQYTTRTRGEPSTPNERSQTSQNAAVGSKRGRHACVAHSTEKRL